MAERHRARIEFVEWDRGYLPGYKGYRRNPPEPIQGVWLKRRVRQRTIRYRVGPTELMTDAEAAAVLRVTRQTIRNWRVAGHLPARRKGGVWYFRYEDVRAQHLKRHGEQKSVYLVN
jgi:excisionase family DNA binding protein